MAAKTYRHDGLTVAVQDGNVTKALREFRRRTEPYLKEIKSRASFVSRSEARRLKKKRAAERRERMLRKEPNQ